MAQRIVTDCDVHGTRDESVPAETFDLVVRRQGEGFRFLTVDLCETCAKPLTDLWVELADKGRSFDGSAAAGLHAAAGSAIRKRPNPLATPTRPRSDSAELKCPACDRDFKNRGTLQKHCRQHHGKRLAELLGESLTHVCPDCGKAFAKAQGLGAHRAKSHGYRTAPA